MSLISGSRNKQIEYIYDLPYTERKYLCNILDINDQWERLGGEFMKFSILELARMKQAEKCGESPTEHLLQHWGYRNNTILKLYNLLYEMQHYQAMSVLTAFVPEKYHILQSQTVFTDTPLEEINGNFSKLRTRMPNPVPPDDIFQSLPPQAYSRGSTLAMEGAIGYSSLPYQINNARPLPPNHDPNMNYPGCDSERDTVGGATSKVPDVLLNSSKSGRNISQVCPASPPFIQEQSNDDNERKKLNASPFGQNGRISPYSCDENISKNQRKEGAKMDFDQEYKEKVNAKYNLGEKEASAIERISQTSTVPLMPSNATAAKNESISDLPNEEPSSNRGRHQSNGSDALSLCSVPSIPYEVLEEATHHWRDDHLLGKGGFGYVYKGKWKHTEVAIKKINQNAETVLGNAPLQISQTLDELQLLQKYRHDNILQVFGYSADADKAPCLVYQFMPYGSLEDRLQLRKIRGFSNEGLNNGRSEPLIWRTRFNIAKGTAAALQFLHTVREKPLIHGDVKSANILLDKNQEPKLGDFGLAREGPRSQYTSIEVSRVHGTRPYIPDEYMRSKRLSTKVDSYSFGIVLFELCTGLKAYNDRRPNKKYLRELVEDTDDRKLLIDAKAGTRDIEVFDALFSLGMTCIEIVPRRRPEMKTAFESLTEFGKTLRELEQTGSIRFSLGELHGSAHPSLLHPSTSPSNNFIMPFTPPHASPVPPIHPGTLVYWPGLNRPTRILSHNHHNSQRTWRPTAPVAMKRQGEQTFSKGSSVYETNPAVSPVLLDPAPTNPNRAIDCRISEEDSQFLPLVSGLGLMSRTNDSKIVTSQGKSTLLDDVEIDEDDDPTDGDSSD